jgi:hypothetical protein
LRKTARQKPPGILSQRMNVTAAQAKSWQFFQSDASSGVFSCVTDDSIKKAGLRHKSGMTP